MKPITEDLTVEDAWLRFMSDAGDLAAALVVNMTACALAGGETETARANISGIVNIINDAKQRTIGQ